MEPTSATVAAVKAWANANGLAMTIISPFGDWISITTSVSLANKLFDAEFRQFTHADSQEQLIRSLSFSLPSELNGHVVTAHPTTTFANPRGRLGSEIKWSARKKRGIKRADHPETDPSCNSTITPACLEQLYEIPAKHATEKSSTLLVTGYDEQFALTDDLKARVSTILKCSNCH